MENNFCGHQNVQKHIFIPKTKCLLSGSVGLSNQTKDGPQLRLFYYGEQKVYYSALNFRFPKNAYCVVQWEEIKAFKLWFYHLSPRQMFSSGCWLIRAFGFARKVVFMYGDHLQYFAKIFSVLTGNCDEACILGKYW